MAWPYDGIHTVTINPVSHDHLNLALGFRRCMDELAIPDQDEGDPIDPG